MAMTKQKDNLAERLRKAREDADAYIDAKANELKASYPTLPVGVLRQTISGRGQCSCGIALHLLKSEDSK